MVNHPNRSNPIHQSTVCYAAHGRTYLPGNGGWSPVHPLFSVLVPVDDQAHAIDYARRHRHGGGPSGGMVLVSGSEDVTHVIPVAREGRRPRNEDHGGLGRLPRAPDASHWSLTSVLWDDVQLRCDFEGNRPTADRGMKVTLTWAELRDAAASDEWYAGVLRRAMMAAM